MTEMSGLLPATTLGALGLCGFVPKRIDLIDEDRNLTFTVSNMHRGDPTIPPDDNHVGDTVHPVLAAESPALVAHESQVDILECTPDLPELVRALLPVDGEYRDLVTRALLLDRRQDRQLLATRTAPGSPERHDDELATIVAQMDPVPGGVSPQVIRYPITDFQLPRVCGSCRQRESEEQTCNPGRTCRTGQGADDSSAQPHDLPISLMSGHEYHARQHGRW